MKTIQSGLDTSSSQGERKWTFEEISSEVERFHGYAAPGVLLGCYMVEGAKSRLLEGTLYDAICETGWCLPDAVQILTPCTIGNGWMRIIHLGLYAVSLYDKYTGRGFRAYLDPMKLEQWPDVADWYLKRKPKHEQQGNRIREQIAEFGPQIYQMEAITVRSDFLIKRSKGLLQVCPLCGEAYPAQNGNICRSCQGNSPYEESRPNHRKDILESPLKAVALDSAVGKKLMHDLTQIIPSKFKGPAFKRGQTITPGDVCRLQQMGRNHLYVETASGNMTDRIHEDQAAEAFAQAMAGSGTHAENKSHEGKVNILAAIDGMLVVEKERLERFNLFPGIMAASRKIYSLVKKNSIIAGTRAIPLFLSVDCFQSALAFLQESPLFQVKPITPVKVGILITGTEVFKGLIQDRFEDIIGEKVRRYGCEVVKAIIVPDDRIAIAKAVIELCDLGTKLIVTTAGLSVDPDDLTLKGLQDAVVMDMLYGIPVLPGSMTLIARIGDTRIIGVPACALYFKTTSFDLLLPRVLAGIRITRADLAHMAHGGLCLNCHECSFPKCTFGK